MRKPIFFLPLVCLFLCLTTPSVLVGEPPRAVTVFTIELDDVSETKARADLLNLFIVESASQLRIDVTLVNKRGIVGTSKPTLYYLDNLRVRPGRLIRIQPKGRTPAFEARIQSVEAVFPTGKPPQLVIRAFGPAPEPKLISRPYPRLSSNNFRGQRSLVEKKGERQPDLITCNGDTPGDFRIRARSLAEVKDVGLAFSTTYLMTSVQHRWDATNGLQTRYQGIRHITKRKRKHTGTR